MIKVLDLFAGTQSVRKALDDMGIEYEYKGIDVYSPEGKNIIIDLATDFTLDMVLDRLNGWKPDFIWASPVCNKISLATAMKGGHNPYFKLDRETQTIEPWPIGSMVDGAKNYQSIIGTQQAHKDALWTLKMFENTKKIINHFDIPFSIENPRHSLTKYIMKEYEINLCSYCMYGFPQQKNTQIFSNKKINLITCNHKRGSHSIGVYGKAGYKKKTLIKEYSNRAAVPPKLIKEIITQLLEGEQNV